MPFNLIYMAIALMLVAILVLILVLALDRQDSKKKKEKSAIPPAKPVVPPAPKVEQPSPQAVNQPVANQSVTRIYAYTSQRTLLRCPGCDGENPTGRSRCMICGCEMPLTRR